MVRSRVFYIRRGPVARFLRDGMRSTDRSPLRGRFSPARATEQGMIGRWTTKENPDDAEADG